MLTRVLNLRILAGAALLMAFIAQVSPASAAPRPSLLGRITDSATGSPISDASVLVSFVGGDPDHPIVIGAVYNASTNPGGHFIVFDLPSGNYVVSVSARGYVSFGDGAHWRGASHWCRRGSGLKVPRPGPSRSEPHQVQALRWRLTAGSDRPGGQSDSWSGRTIAQAGSYATTGHLRPGTRASLASRVTKGTPRSSARAT